MLNFFVAIKQPPSSEIPQLLCCFFNFCKIVVLMFAYILQNQIPQPKVSDANIV
jgi:hypothetical protein